MKTSIWLFLVNRYSRTKYSSFALFNQNPPGDEEWSLHEHNLINIAWSSSWATSWNSEIDHYIYIYPLRFHWESGTRTNDLSERGDCRKDPNRPRSKNSRPTWSTKTGADHEEAICLIFLSDWERETHEFRRPMKVRIKTKKMQFRMF